jgi:hypothetical protein
MFTKVNICVKSLDPENAQSAASNAQVPTKSIVMKKFWDEFTRSTIFADGNKK